MVLNLYRDFSNKFPDVTISKLCMNVFDGIPEENNFGHHQESRVSHWSNYSDLTRPISPRR